MGTRKHGRWGGKLLQANLEGLTCQQEDTGGLRGKTSPSGAELSSPGAQRCPGGRPWTHLLGEGRCLAGTGLKRKEGRRPKSEV